ncbi:helix-turn-helix domain-containing protein [Ulvibacterium sp.]|uniref:winged helix-turn-helix transcriptional regulator n=1 Tax=Ulvibacterium sp. TaxID=2665914 RepID=UPI0026344E0C|nr:helix-turn-helix domain-containing protein [Ulvibacterium sp.]
METLKESKNQIQMPDFDLNCFNIYQCPVTATMDIIGGKWKPMILFLIYKGVNRFGKLSGLLKGVSKRTLTKQLRDLESDGVLHRQIFPEVPPRVEYSLTNKGQSLLVVIKVLYEWGERNR